MYMYVKNVVTVIVCLFPELQELFTLDFGEPTSEENSDTPQVNTNWFCPFVYHCFLLSLVVKANCAG